MMYNRMVYCNYPHKTKKQDYLDHCLVIFVGHQRSRWRSNHYKIFKVYRSNKVKLCKKALLVMVTLSLSKMLIFRMMQFLNKVQRILLLKCHCAQICLNKTNQIQYQICTYYLNEAKCIMSNSKCKHKKSLKIKDLL